MSSSSAAIHIYQAISKHHHQSYINIHISLFINIYLYLFIGRNLWGSQTLAGVLCVLMGWKYLDLTSTGVLLFFTALCANYACGAIFGRKKDKKKEKEKEEK